jgi:hypothetical protein
MGLDVDFYVDDKEVEYMRKCWHLFNTAYAFCLIRDDGKKTDDKDEQFRIAYSIGSAMGHSSAGWFEVTNDEWGKIINKALETEKQKWAEAWGFHDYRREDYLKQSRELLKYDKMKIKWVN